MNKNLLKVLTIGALALSLGACSKKGGDNPDTPVDPEGHGDYVIEEIFELDGSNYKYEGEEVTVKHVCVYSAVDKMLLVGYDGTQGVHPGSDKLKGFEVELGEAPTWDPESPTSGVYADVNVKGTLTNVNGRPVLKNGSVEINGEAYFDEEGSRITTKGSQMSCGYYDLTSKMDPEALLEQRETWDGHFGRSASGVFVEGVFQIASKPAEELTADTSSAFYLVFPGENTDGSDEENEYRIYTELPAGLTRQVKSNAAGAQAGDKIPAYQWYNNFFATLSVGDYVLVDAMTRYDSAKAGMTLFMDQFFSIGYSKKTSPVEGIITTWAEIANKFEGKYTVDVPNLALETQGVFSYNFSDYYAYNVEDVWKDSSWILVNHKTAGAFQAQFNCGIAKVESTREKLQEKLVAAEYELDDTVDVSDGEFIYVKKESETVVAEVLLTEGDNCVVVTFIGTRPTEEFATFAEACAKLEEKASASAETALAINMPALPEAAADGLTSATLAWPSEKDFDGVLQYSISLEFEDGTFADEDAWEEFVKGMNDSMIESAGYAPDYELPALLAEGLCLTSNNVLVVWGFDKNDDAEVIGVTMYAFFDISDDGYIYDVGEDSVWDEEMYYYYAYDKLDAMGWNASCYGGLTENESVFDCTSTISETSFYKIKYQAQVLAELEKAIPACASVATPKATTPAAGDPYIAAYYPEYVSALTPLSGTNDIVTVYELNGSDGSKVKITLASYALGYLGNSYCSAYIAFETVTA